MPPVRRHASSTLPSTRSTMHSCTISSAVRSSNVQRGHGSTRESDEVVDAARVQHVGRVVLRRQRERPRGSSDPRLEAVDEHDALGRRRQRREQQRVVAPRAIPGDGAGREAARCRRLSSHSASSGSSTATVTSLARSRAPHRCLRSMRVGGLSLQRVLGVLLDQLGDERRSSRSGGWRRGRRRCRRGSTRGTGSGRASADRSGTSRGRRVTGRRPVSSRRKSLISRCDSSVVTSHSVRSLARAGRARRP